MKKSSKPDQGESSQKADPDELTIEEQTIMWAAQRGGALNIERNENG